MKRKPKKIPLWYMTFKEISSDQIVVRGVAHLSSIWALEMARKTLMPGTWVVKKMKYSQDIFI